MDEQKSGPELIEEIGADPTIDLMMRRDPRSLTDEDFRRLIVAQREKRAMFIKDNELKRAKKAGVENPGEEPSNPEES